MHTIYITINGRDWTFQELHQQYGLNTNTMRERYREGVRGADLIRSSRSSTQMIQLHGKLRSVYDIADHYGINISTLKHRYRRGIREDELIRPVAQQRTYRISFHGTKYRVNELSKLYGIHPSTLRKRYQQGRREDDLVTPPNQYHRVHVMTIDVHGRSYTFAQMSRHFHVSETVLRYRYRLGKRKDELFRPVQNQTPITVKLYGKDWLSRQCHLNRNTIKRRYYDGYRGEELISHRDFWNRKVKHYTFHALSQRFGIQAGTLQYRYHRGDRDNDLVRPIAKGQRRLFTRKKNIKKEKPVEDGRIGISCSVH